MPAEKTTLRTSQDFKTLVTANLTQPLSQLYRIDLGIRQSEVNRGVAQEQLRGQRQSVVNNVKHVYYGLLQTQSAIEASEEALIFLRELERVTDTCVAQQAALKSESLSVKTQLANAEYRC